MLNSLPFALIPAFPFQSSLALSKSGTQPSLPLLNEFMNSFRELSNSLIGLKADSLLLLGSTSIIIPLFKVLNLSPIIGFLLFGTLLGPNGLNLIHNIHLIEHIGEIGIVLFLFEMGLELSLKKLISMKNLVLGLGFNQFVITSFLIAGICKSLGLSVPASISIGGSLALSSSAFVLQILKEKSQLNDQEGQASFGILLLQDLAVVPLLIIVELFSKGATGISKALGIASLKIIFAVSILSLSVKKVFLPLFDSVKKSDSGEAFLSCIFTTLFSLSFFTKGIGLSDTLGAFLSGILLAETKFRHQIEEVISPLRGLLLGIFFMTVGFNIDFKLIFQEFPKLIFILSSIIILKASVITILCKLFGLSSSKSSCVGLLNSQVGEFAFVSLNIAAASHMIDENTSKLLTTSVALSMALTPLLAEIGKKLSVLLDFKKEKKD